MVSMYSTIYVDDIREIKEQNPFESMMSRFDRAAQLLDLDPDLYAVLRVPNRELKVYIPTRMDSGPLHAARRYPAQCGRRDQMGGSPARRTARGMGRGGTANDGDHPDQRPVQGRVAGPERRPG